jgi:hypothetical protein
VPALACHTALAAASSAQAERVSRSASFRVCSNWSWLCSSSACATISSPRCRPPVRIGTCTLAPTDQFVRKSPKAGKAPDG